MMKECFECQSDVILTDVIHLTGCTGITLYGTGALIGRFVTEKIVEYTCRMCGTKWYVTVGYEEFNEEITCTSQNYLKIRIFRS
jgi:hypothetical protein